MFVVGGFVMDWCLYCVVWVLINSVDFDSSFVVLF